MSNLDSYGFRSVYKGTVIDKLSEEDDKLLIYVPDILLNKNISNGIQESYENINTLNIVNKESLRLTNNVKTLNGLICKPLYINGFLPNIEIGSSVMVIMFDKDPKKLFYLHISTEPLKIQEELPEDTTIRKTKDGFVIKKGKNIIRMNKDYIELEGVIKMKEENICGNLENLEE